VNQADTVVVGAGITGLTCAYRLQKLGIKTLVLESGNRIGGVIRSERINGHLVEWGPTSLLPTPHTFGLLEELGLDNQLESANPKSPALRCHQWQAPRDSSGSVERRRHPSRSCGAPRSIEVSQR
jgi:protoporphyrinogen oxidase